MVTRVRIADTEAIAQFFPVYKEGVKISRIIALNYGKWSRRRIRLLPDEMQKLEKIIAEDKNYV